MSTYLPLPELESKRSRYAEEEGSFFLNLGEPITSDTYRVKWGFLVDHLGIGHTDYSCFYLHILNAIRFDNDAADISRKSRILDLYEVLHARCREAKNVIGEQASTR